MNRRQKVALLCGILLAVAVGLYPPWTHWAEGSGGQSIERPAVYGPIVDPPSPPNEIWSTRIDYGRLGVQWIVVGLLTGGAMVLLRSDPDDITGEDNSA